MRKLILAPMALACLIGHAAAQQAPTTNVGNFPATQAVTQSGAWGFGLTGPIPAGSNVIGGVTQSGGPWSVSGTVLATQSGSWTVGLSAGASVLADLRVAGAAVTSGNPVPVSVGNFPSSQVVTNAGTFAVQNTAAMPAGSNTIGSLLNISGAISLPTGAATSANQSSQIVALGTTGDAAYAGSGTASVISALKGVYAGMVAPTPAGTNVIGSTSLRSPGTNRSATVGTTASTLMAANTARQGWKIKNDSAGDIWVNFDAAATAAPGSGNIKIPAGAYLSSEPGFVETGAMSVIGSAASLAITAREY